jgi:hypothetical protein
MRDSQIINTVLTRRMHRRRNNFFQQTNNILNGNKQQIHFDNYVPLSGSLKLFSETYHMVQYVIITNN